VLDFATVREDIREDCALHAVREVAYDPWQATQLANELQEHGLTAVEVKNSVQNFSEPMKQWEALVLQRRFHHNGNPVFRWMVSNVVCWRDRKDNIYPRKEKPENKIDGPVATVMALNRALLAPAAEAFAYESRGFLTL
jgi:phage terminase large subunit-like protein